VTPRPAEPRFGRRGEDLDGREVQEVEADRGHAAANRGLLDCLDVEVEREVDGRAGVGTAATLHGWLAAVHLWKPQSC
jgi:hypothetical protein